MNDVIKSTEQFVKSILGDDPTGHDWYHIERVRNNALYIWEKEQKGDPFIIEMAALLHDVPDEKLNSTKEEGNRKLEEFLVSLSLEQAMKTKIHDIINSISFKGGSTAKRLSAEAEIVQDADRLDAIGAIGIARTFAYGGKKGQPIYDPDIAVREHMSEVEYRNGKSTSIHHFYEKLLKLKDLLNTSTAREMAERRHLFMGKFLKEFYIDWTGTNEHTLD